MTSDPGPVKERHSATQSLIQSSQGSSGCSHASRRAAWWRILPEAAVFEDFADDVALMGLTCSKPKAGANSGMACAIRDGVQSKNTRICC